MLAAIILILFVLITLGFSHREEAKLDKAVEPVEAIQHGVKAMIWTVIAVAIAIVSLLAYAASILPPVGK